MRLNSSNLSTVDSFRLHLHNVSPNSTIYQRTLISRSCIICLYTVNYHIKPLSKPYQGTFTHQCIRRQSYRPRAHSKQQPTSSLALSLDSLQPGDLLQLSTPSHTFLVECVKHKRTVQFLCSGELSSPIVEIDDDCTKNSQSLSPSLPSSLKHQGYFPKLGDTWIKQCPALLAALSKHRKVLETMSILPSILLSNNITIQKLTSLSDFKDQVLSSPSLWCDGTGPSDPPLTKLEQSLLTAGELIAFAHGLRGIALVQLDVGWEEEVYTTTDNDSGNAAFHYLDRQPLLRPFVLPLLSQLSKDKDITFLPSPLPQGLGSTLILTSKKQPYKAWAQYLADTKVQAALVADSPYYKMMIGVMLGYKMRNIEHHIVSTGGGGLEGGRVREMVERDLSGLSGVEATLPWR